MALALARKYRPRSFAEVAVQDHVSNTLKGAIARGRVAHGYLLCGPRGTGKTTLARVLAMALNCERRRDAARRLAELEAAKGGSGGAGASPDETLAREASEPCGACESCSRIWSGSASLDVVEIDAASNRGVDDARDLRERAMYAPTGDDRYKVYIVDEAHMLTREAWNALLKILEEPPPRVVFVFATTEPQKIAQAAAPVMSRVQRFDLRRIGPGEIRSRLAHVLDREDVPYEEDALGMIARAADGGLRDALSLTDQVLSLGDESHVTAARVREALGLVPEDEYVSLLDVVAERRAGEVFAAVQRLADAGADFALILAGFADALRAQLAITLGGLPPDLSERMRVALEERKGRLRPGDILRMLQAILELEPRFKRSGQPQLLFETMLVRFALMDRTLDLEEVLRGVADGGGGGASGAARASDATRAAPALASPRPDARPASSPPAPPSPGDWRSALAAESSPPSRIPPEARSAAAAAPARPVPKAFALDDGAAGAPAVSAAAPAAAAAAVPVSPARPAAPAPAPMASTSVPARPAANGGRIPDLSTITGRWDEVVAATRAEGRAAVAALLSATEPVAIAATGTLTVEVADETAEQGLLRAHDVVVQALRSVVGGVERLAIRRAEGGEQKPLAARRITNESVKEERQDFLRKKDPVLGAAIDALDLELLD